MPPRAGPKRRILVLNERDPRHPRAGGAETHVARIFARLVDRGHRVTQLSAGYPGGEPQARIDGIRVERRRPLAAYYAATPGRVRRRTRRGEFDVVVECLNKIPFYSPIYSHVPVLALCHHLFGEVAFDQVSWPIASGVVLLEKGLERGYRESHFLAISESTRDDLIARGIRADRIVVSHPGIDRPHSSPPDPKAPRETRMTYVGRLEPYKRIDVFLEAAARLVADFPDLEVFVIGRGSAEASLRDLANRLGIAERTRFAGFVPEDERDRILAASRVCSFPSPKEGFGLTVIEANALGTPVVATDAPGLRDSIRDGVTGHLVAGNDPAAHAEALARLLREDDDAWQMRRAARAWSEGFDWERAADDMEVAIEQTIEEARA